ncbi:MAG: TolC family protein [Candidatus Latescibacterota bacterium]
MKGGKTLTVLLYAMLCGSLLKSCSVYAQEPVSLTLESAVEIAMANSYNIRQLQLGIERTRYNLKARQAGLKSKVYMNLRVPNFNYISDYKWNSDLQRDEIIKENNGLWQMDLSIRQPVVLLGYPTNGYLSLNNKTYRYLQKTEGGVKNTNFYNRYFVRYEQPFFRPNTLKNDIEEGELDLQRNELEYLNNQVNLIESIGYDYYNLFRMSYYNEIYSRQIVSLEQAAELSRGFAEKDTTRAIETIQVQVDLANAKERLLSNQSSLRLGLARLKQRLRLTPGDSLFIQPDVQVIPVTVDLKRATEYACTLRPRLQLLNINRRQNEIDLQNTKGWNSFSVNLEMTYGLEKQHEEYQQLWEEYDNSYSVAVNAYIPIWDWGQHKAQIEAQKISLQRTELYREEARSEIESEVLNGVETLNEFQRRALTMNENLDVATELTAMSFEQYRENRITMQDLIQVISRQRDTENNFIEAYLGYRRALLSLMVDTFYDFEKKTPLLDRFTPREKDKTE